VGGRILTADTMKAHSRFEISVVVKPTTFPGARLTTNGAEVRMPPESVVILDLPWLH
jgi:alpha-L-arabinofuranosidase